MINKSMKTLTRVLNPDTVTISQNIFFYFRRRVLMLQSPAFIYNYIRTYNIYLYTIFISTFYENITKIKMYTEKAKLGHRLYSNQSRALTRVTSARKMDAFIYEYWRKCIVYNTFPFTIALCL